MSVDTRPAGTDRPTRTPPRPDAAPRTPEPPRPPGRRSPTWIALGIVAICLGGLLSFVVYRQVAAESSVVGVAHTVYRGEVIEQGDLRPLPIRTGTVPGAIPATELDHLVGQRAAYDLVEGAVVIEKSVTDAAVPGDGRAVVGLRLEQGRAPSSLLVPAAAVRIVALPPATTGAGETRATRPTSYSGRIVSQSAGADGTSVLVDVEVDADEAATIAQLAAQDRVALVRDAGR